jgi:hypothetical protein
MAQIHAVIQRLISHPDEKIRGTVFKAQFHEISLRLFRSQSITAVFFSVQIYFSLDHGLGFHKIWNYGTVWYLLVPVPSTGR